MSDAAQSPQTHQTEDVLATSIRARVTTLLAGRSPRLGAARMLAVDGPAGSGKTTFAGQLAASWPTEQGSARVLHMDDLYDGWTGLDVALETRVLDQVLRPLAQGEPARWQCYDWRLARFEQWHDLAPSGLLVLEGCGAGAARYAAYTSALVWVEATAETRLARGVQRDGAEVLPRWRAWMQLEEAYFEANRVRDRADVRLVT